MAKTNLAKTSGKLIADFFENVTSITKKVAASKMTMAQPFKTFDPGTLTGHPFGRENEVAVGQLWKFFCNNVYLGQWELARAVAKELYQQREVLGSSVTDILRRIIENPYGFR